jgi:hypothetical protein
MLWLSFLRPAAKAILIEACIQGPEQAAEKVRMKANSAKDGLAGAKARLVLLTLSARLKPCPCYKALSIEFFRSL